MFFNIRGLISHLAELTAVLRLSTKPPALVCLNENFLDPPIEEVMLEGYILVARRDRDDGRKCGGVAVFARSVIASNVALVEKSSCSERM